MSTTQVDSTAEVINSVDVKLACVGVEIAFVEFIKRFEDEIYGYQHKFDMHILHK